MNQFLRHAAAATGLAVIAWVGAGYLLTNPLALVLTLMIGAFYVMGVLELQRFRRATLSLATAVDALAATPASLAAWLEQLPAGLRNAVRRRVEGEPVGLPGPALAPMLAGLLVLLGMLGTFLGMILTLRGTGAALETATDLVSVRNSLIAPVKGLGLAFGTSVAGVAASAALGLLSALGRRERVAVAQRLDARIATTLRPFSVAWQREEQLGLLRRQAELLPALVDGLKAMMDTMALQAEASQARLLASQERFQGQAESAYTQLAQSVDRTLQASLTEGARIAGETIRPVAEATLAGIARETATLHATLAGTMQEQVARLSASFEASTASSAGAWQALLARHEQSAQSLAAGVEASHARFAQTFEQRSAALLDAVAQRQAGWQGEMATALAGMARETAAMQQSIAGTAAAQLEGAGARLDAAVERVTAAWADAVARQQDAGTRLSEATEQSLSTAAATFERHSASLLQTVQHAHAELQASSATRDQQRVDAMAASLEAMAASLQAQWQQAGAQSLEQQQRVVETMERTARDITVQAETQARATIAEIARLVQAASEAPRAAAEVISELRQKLADSMARDNTMLDERARILQTLGTLLDGVNRAAGEQRGAIDALVTSSADVLERVGERFHAQVQAEAGRLVDVAAQVTGSAAEVASLGEAFGVAVQRFAESGERLGAHLERIDVALGAQMERSDEQLAYYVAQAREVIDLSILSQKQIIEELQRVAGRRAAEAEA
jgi:predicted secreted protein